MKKILILLLLVSVIGCASKQAKDDVVYRPAAKCKGDLYSLGDVDCETGAVRAKEVIVEDVAIVEEDIKDIDLSDEEVRKEIALVFKDILFDYDKYVIRADARPYFSSIASWMNEHLRTKIIIEGHCDERGTNEYNLALGEKRANAAKNYLISLGVSPSRMTVITYGEEKPVCSSHDEGCWQLNRRAHFVVTE